MSRLRPLIVPALLTLAVGATTSIVAMNAALAILLGVFVLAGTPDERRRFGAFAVILVPFALGGVIAYLANWGLPPGKLRYLFAWLALPLTAAFLPAVDERRWLRWFFGAATVAAVLGFWQHLQGIGVFDTGLCNFTHEQYNGAVRKLLCGFKAGTRARGFFYTPMTYAAVVLFVLIAAIALRTRLSPRRAAVTVVFLLTALLVSSTRSAWFGLLAALPFLLGMNKRAWLGAAAAAVLFGGVALTTPVLRARITSLANVQTDPASSTGARIFLWQDALAQFREKPVFGWGPGTFRANVERRHPDVKLLSNKHAHNNYLHTMAESGLVGLAGFLATFGWLAVLAWRAPAPYRSLGLGLIAAFAVSGLFEAGVLDSEVVINLLVWAAFVTARKPAESTAAPAAL